MQAFWLTARDTLSRWIFQWRGPEEGTVLLDQRRVFILPTRHGWLFAVILVLMLIGAINYDLSLGFLLAFLLGAAGLQSMLHTFRNLAHLRITPARTEPVFAGELAAFPLLISNETRLDRFALAVTADGKSAEFFDVESGGSSTVTVRVPARKRGWLHAGRLTLFTRYPVGLFRAWSYVQPALPVLVYPAPAPAGVPLPPPHAGDRIGGVHGNGQDEFQAFRAYRPGDSLRHIAWKALARKDELLTKQFAGQSNAELWLDWWAIPDTGDMESRLSQLARWVLDAEAAGLSWGLRLPGFTLDIASGPAHRRACLQALALFETA
jgi:uncharacterized protein (DUF58 family)